MKQTELSKEALTVAQSRYFMENESWEDCALRCATAISAADSNSKYKDKFFEMIYGREFLPGGRILRNSGRARGSLFNCFHLPIGDSIEEIGQYIKDSLTLWSEGGGVGCNFSSLRPRGDKIMGKGGESSGLVSFIEAANYVSQTIESGGSRRAAAIAHVDISHPEVIDFINAKLVDGRLNHVNISVAINEDFLNRVEMDGMWAFKFKQQTYNSMPAREIWDTIVTNMINNAEPGLLNWDKFTKNNSYYFAPVLGTNPCISKGTLISTTEGLIPVEELCDKKFTVITDLRSINQQGSFAENAKCWYSGKKQIFKVILSNNQSICLTENHKVFVKEGDVVIKKQVKDLELNETMMVQNSISPHLISLDKNKDEFKDGLFVGWMLGDGWVSDAYIDKKENRVSIGFIVGDSELTAKKFLKEKINEIKADWELPVGWLNSSGGAKSFEMTSSSKEVQNYFKQYGYNSSEDNKTIPNEILKQSHSFKRGFLAGLFSADGFCDTYKNDVNYRIGFSSCKKNIIDRVQIMLSEFGINSKTGSAIVKCNLNDKWYNHFNLTIQTSRDCMIFMNEIGFHLSDKKEKSGWTFPKHKWRKKLTGEYKIKSIELVGEEDVYDINTDITHSLIANGILIANCGETTLEPYGVCNLGSLVLPNFITNVNTNWKRLGEVIELGVRFLDNVTDVNKYVLNKNDIAAHASRRIGIGVMGVADYLFAKKLRYGSEKAVQEIERLMRFIRDKVYESSIKLAVEKGSFPKFDPIPYGKASFVRKLPASIRMDIKKHGVRNCTMMAMAPTGTISLLADTTSGVEPLFSRAYLRSDRVGERIYVHPTYKALLEEVEKPEDVKIPEWFVDTSDLKPEDHFEIQVAIQKYVDGSVSKTINVPEHTTKEDLSRLLLEYIYDLKGCTVYRDGSREGQILTKLDNAEVKKIMVEDRLISNSLDSDDVQCATGTCNI